MVGKGGLGWLRAERTRVHLALLTVQVGYGVYYVLTKSAMSSGVNRFVFAVYRDVIGFSLLAPLAYFSEREKRAPFTVPVCLLIMALGFTGIYLQQTLFLAGLAYTNTAFAAAMQNAIPVFTFMIAVVCKLEMIRARKIDGIAKVFGIVACVSGALIMTIYKGPAVLGTAPVFVDVPPQVGKDKLEAGDGWLVSTLLNLGMGYWQIGSLCLIANCLCMGIYTNLQIPALKRFPAPISLTASSIFVGAIALAITGALTVGDSSEWILTGKTDIISVVYAGAIASGLNFSLQSWSNQRGGPVLVAAYIPLQTFFSAVLGLIILGDAFYLGSLIGSVLILSGLYLVIWGQNEQRRSKNREADLPIRITNDNREPLLRSISEDKTYGSFPTVE